MSESAIIVRLLRAIHRRVRANLGLQEVTDWAIRLLAVWLLLVAWNRTMPVRIGIGWPIFVLAGLALTVHLVTRLARQAPLWEAAARADSDAQLHDELISAYWFARHPEESEWVELHVERAASRATKLDPGTLVPLERPRRIAVPIVLATLLVALSVASVPRVFDDLVEQLAAIGLSGDEQEAEPVAELQDAGAREEDPAGSEERNAEDEMALPQLEEQQEGQDALPEEGAPTEEGTEDPVPEGEPMEGEEGEQGEAGEENEGQSMEVDNPEDVPAESEGEQAPDPNASQQEGEGESTEESGEMLPGGEEVFLQEGGEELEQKELGGEDLGHATREGGMEQELEEGELSTLGVELEREILAVPEQEEQDPTEEEKEEEITRAERSFLEFETVSTPGEFARQEILESEPIPWRYRQLVLRYFRALRERDNQHREERE